MREPELAIHTCSHKFIPQHIWIGQNYQIQNKPHIIIEVLVSELLRSFTETQSIFQNIVLTK